jgi:hypothetical protein
VDRGFHRNIWTYIPYRTVSRLRWTSWSHHNVSWHFPFLSPTHTHTQWSPSLRNCQIFTI